MKRKIIIPLFFGLILCILISCSSKQSKDERSDSNIGGATTINDTMFPKELIIKKQNKERIPEFDSEFSLGYKNADGSCTAFIFSTPIRYKAGMTFKDINNNLSTVKRTNYKSNYAFENNSNDIKVYYPKTLSQKVGFLLESYFYQLEIGIVDNNYKMGKRQNNSNIWGLNRDSINYLGNNNNLNINCYSTNLGMHAEVSKIQPSKLTQMKLWIRSPMLTPQISEGGDIVFNDEKGTVQGILHSPILKNEKDNTFFLNNSILLNYKGDSLYTIEFVFNKDAFSAMSSLTLDLACEMHHNNLPDSVIYSKKPEKNFYLSEFHFIGNSPMLGIGKSYSRLRIQNYISENANNIKSAYWGAYQCLPETTLLNASIYKVNELWSSSELLWNNALVCKEKLTSQTIKGQGYYYFDLTQWAKMALSDESFDTESFGIMLQSEDSENYKVFASSDNALFPTFIKINFNKLPEKH